MAQKVERGREGHLTTPLQLALSSVGSLDLEFLLKLPVLTQIGDTLLQISVPCQPMYA